ncbi:proteasome accessory factor PafA2 [Enemella dayhoffiae]|uniref:Proteasome accessory factor PafA2 n=1 Tax=Enemella dayhoffiae TaxID=2016507 RepID=A0A255H9Z9_9ACTN|nr:depupylase/deamidase Dop [Enemella dayhoffiae]OYO24262.1 proteasome accessory factor PafA2 [Enemella dayhoffiae]
MAQQVFGLETEYGIAVGGQGPATGLHPMHWANLLVRGYGELAAAGQRWDYETEHPLDDARGFTVDRRIAHPDQLTDDDSMANLVLTNGARLYVDHAHPEYSGPEVTSARDAVLWDAAGDHLVHLAAQNASARLGQPLRLWKNNTDGKGASYGTHENYLLSRATPFHRIVLQFTGFLVTRQPLTGAGRVGLGQYSDEAGYQLSQRADFFEAEVGLETTLNRPVINTRDEPHAQARVHRRLHVITGDANRSEYAGWLKIGTAALVLAAIEVDLCADLPRLADPVAAMHDVSHDLSLSKELPLTEGAGTITALALQEAYADRVDTLLRTRPELIAHPDEATELLAAWRACLDALRRDPMELADRLDWVAKLKLLESYRARDGMDWDAPKLALIDLQYAEIDPARSLYHALIRKGRMRRLLTDDEIERARLEPPTDTRAYFRGECMRRYPDQVVAASWDSMILDLPHRRSLLRIPMLDPLRGTRAHLGDKLESAEDLGQLITQLGY